jgi:hypothetical protein
MLVSFNEFINENHIRLEEIDDTLREIGTDQDYLEYLETIFPESKIKQIMFHKTNAEKFEEFKLSYLGGAYFSFYDMQNGKNLPKFLRNILTRLMKQRTLLAKVNVKNPLIINRKNAKIIMKKTGLLTQSVSALRKHFDLSEYDSILGYPNERKDRGELDEVKQSLDNGGDIEVDLSHIDPKHRDIIELAIFNPKDIHILGSRADIAGFRNYMEQKNSINNSK